MGNKKQVLGHIKVMYDQLSKKPELYKDGIADLEKDHPELVAYSLADRLFDGNVKITLYDTIW